MYYSADGVLGRFSGDVNGSCSYRARDCVFTRFSSVKVRRGRGVDCPARAKVNFTLRRIRVRVGRTGIVHTQSIRNFSD